ncbi:MFS transporter [Amycolatopsis nigrescens]|uniref:MFS transporter n=1 Tax=Amycolatopsis nigrescens TaxID=381445 RepID=UPI000381A80D|nr:MFS transporter [Amycolatopsis nigrescens]
MTKPEVRPDGAVASTAPFGRTVLVMTISGLLVVGQMYLVLPLFSAMAADWQTTASAVTWTTTAFGLAYAGGFLLTGPLSDRLGRRRVVVTGLSVLAVATVVAAFAPSLPVAIACRIAQGIGAAGFSPAALAYLTERIAPARRSVALTCLVTAMVASTVTGQLVAQALLPIGGWRGVFVINACLVAALAATLRVVMLPEQATGARGSLGSFFGAMAKLVTRPVLLLIDLGALTVLGSFVAVYTALQLLGPDELGRPDVLLGLRASALPALVAIPFLAPVLAKLRATFRAALALVIGAAAVLGLAFAGGSSLLTIGALLFLFVAAIAAVSPGLTELTGMLSGPARGAGVALYTFSLMAGASLGPQLVSLLGGSGFTTVLVAICVLQLAGAALLLTAERFRPR